MEKEYHYSVPPQYEILEENIGMRNPTDRGGDNPPYCNFDLYSIACYRYFLLEDDGVLPGK